MPDLLEYDQQELANGDVPEDLFGIEINLLRSIREELRRSHSSQRAVIDVQYTNPLKILDAFGDRAVIRFLNQGVRVKSLYTVICNNTSTLPIAIGINEPVQNTTARNTGIRLATGATIILEPEIEEIQLAIVIGTTGNAVIINNYGTIATQGSIQIYGWTLPEEGR